MTDKRMSFLPEDYVEQRVDQRTNVLCLTLFVVVLAGVVGAYVVTSRQRTEIRQQQARINEAFAEAARRIEQLDQLREQKQTMLQKAQVTAALLEPVPRTFLLADLINRMPETMSLFELQLSTQLARKPGIKRDRTALRNKKLIDIAKERAEKQQAAEAPPSQLAIVLEGVAPTDVQVAQYMASLSDSNLLEDVSLIYSEQSKVHDASVRKFRIEMKLADLADVRRIDPILKPRRLETDPMRSKDPLESGTVLTPNPPGADGASASGEGGAFSNLFQKLTGPTGGREK